MKLAPLLVLLLSADLSAATLRFVWTPNPAAEQVTNYILFASTNVAGPFVQVAQSSGTNTSLVLDGAVLGQAFYYVKAVNFWGASDKSEVVNTPKLATGVTGTFLLLPVAKTARDPLSIKDGPPPPPGMVIPPTRVEELERDKARLLEEVKRLREQKAREETRIITPDTYHVVLTPDAYPVATNNVSEPKPKATP